MLFLKHSLVYCPFLVSFCHLFSVCSFYVTLFVLPLHYFEFFFLSPFLVSFDCSRICSPFWHTLPYIALCHVKTGSVRFVLFRPFPRFSSSLFPSFCSRLFNDGTKVPKRRRVSRASGRPKEAESGVCGPGGGRGGDQQGWGSPHHRSAQMS